MTPFGDGKCGAGNFLPLCNVQQKQDLQVRRSRASLGG